MREMGNLLLRKLLNKNREKRREIKILSKLILVASLVFIVMLSGCVENIGDNGLIIRLDAPQSVRAKQEFSVFLELNNRGSQTYKMSVDFFDVGMFKKKSECKKEFELKPMFEKSIDCKLVFDYDKDLTQNIEETIHSIIRYSTQFSIVKSFIAMTQEEYENRRITKRLEDLPKVFFENNGDIEVTIELSENPIIVRDIDSYLYIKIKNVGEGFVNDLKKSDIEIKMIPDIVTNCDIDDKISISRSEAIIPCKIELKNLKESYLNVYTIINIKYDYEIKKSAKINIIR